MNNSKSLSSRFAKLILTFSASAAIGAAPLFAADTPKSVSIAIRPQPTSRPALKHHLLPNGSELLPGDAAPVYLVGALLWRTGDNDPYEKNIDGEDAKRLGLTPPKESELMNWKSAFLAAPLEKLRTAPGAKVVAGSLTVDGMIASRADAIEYFDIAARRENCHWDMPVKELGFRTLLPYLSVFRDASTAICIKARWQIANGDPAGAIRTLRSNFALVRALNQQAFLVQSLVAVSIGAQSLNVLREAVQQPGCPNLYWALADLPRPMVDVRSALETERALAIFTPAQLTRARAGKFTEEDWRDSMSILAKLGGIDSGGKAPVMDLGSRFGLAAFGAVLLPEAKQFLIERGTPREDLESWPPAAVLGKYMADSGDEILDDITKWANLPLWQGREGALKVEKEMADLQKRGLVKNPILVIVPAISRATLNLRYFDRNIAALQTIEALRDYAASHDGKLPATLDAITATPPPLDPITGKHFVYSVAANTATIESHLQDERPTDALVWKVTIQK